MSKYNYLKDQYPNVISKEQLWKICKISKYTAQFYLTSGIIPCKDSGKKTRRYSIRIDDVIDFLEKRDKKELPPGAYMKHLRKRPPSKYKQPIIEKTKAYKKAVLEYFEKLLSSSQNIMDTEDVANITGLSRQTIQRNIQNGILDAVVVRNSYVIYKRSLLHFLMNEYYLKCKGTSKTYHWIQSDIRDIKIELEEKRKEKNRENEIKKEGKYLKETPQIKKHFENKLKLFPSILTINDLCTLLCIEDVKYIRGLLRRCNITSVKVKGKLLVPNKAILIFLNGSEFEKEEKILASVWIKEITK